MAAEGESHFATLAILDLETSDIPTRDNDFTTAITEICIFGVASKYVREEHMPVVEAPVPATPRMLHKLTLLMDPGLELHPKAAEKTGLSNAMLKHEKPFNENAATTVLGFLQHLPQPILLVAHNGWSFDFPIVRQTFAKINTQLPENTNCVDSLRAFLEIDIMRRNLPAGPLHFTADASMQRKKYPPRYDYQLEPMYRRIFGQAPAHAHHAEADVDMLLKLILHYGEDFMAYAQQLALPLAQSPKLGKH